MFEEPDLDTKTTLKPPSRRHIPALRRVVAMPNGLRMIQVNRDTGHEEAK